MVIQHKQTITIEEFEQFIYLPENVSRNFEYIGGYVVDTLTTHYCSVIGANILTYIVLFVKQNNLGRVTGADGGYIIGGDRYIPDVAFISYAKQPSPCRDAYNPNPPDLAVEVLSPNNAIMEITTKVVNYLRVGTTVWVFDPDAKRAMIYQPDKEPLTIDFNGSIDGGDILPGFTLALKDAFPQEEA